MLLQTSALKMCRQVFSTQANPLYFEVARNLGSQGNGKCISKLRADVFWVFASPKVVGENVMLTVATSSILSGPTRLLFPRAAGSVGEAAAFPFSLLGRFLGIPCQSHGS